MSKHANQTGIIIDGKRPSNSPNHAERMYRDFLRSIQVRDWLYHGLRLALEQAVHSGRMEIIAPAGTADFEKPKLATVPPLDPIDWAIVAMADLPEIEPFARLVTERQRQQILRADLDDECPGPVKPDVYYEEA